MNIVLFTEEELSRPLPRTDRRAAHLLDVLRLPSGGTFDAGVINGAAGKGRITAIGARELRLAFDLPRPPAAAGLISLAIGCPRPQTARDILREATALGAGALHFVATEKSEPSYTQSRLWRDGEWRRHVQAGAEQAFTTRVPEVTFGRPLPELLASLPANARRLALDNYEAGAALANHPDAGASAGRPLLLAFGPERGWSAADRAALRAANFGLVHLGARVLRLETAIIAALTLVKAARGEL